MGYDTSKPPPTPSNCDFCGNHHPEMIRGKIGGFKSRICIECIRRYAAEDIQRTTAQQPDTIAADD